MKKFFLIVISLVITCAVKAQVFTYDGPSDPEFYEDVQISVIRDSEVVYQTNGSNLAYIYSYLPRSLRYEISNAWYKFAEVSSNTERGFYDNFEYINKFDDLTFIFEDYTIKISVNISYITFAFNHLRC